VGASPAQTRWEWMGQGSTRHLPDAPITRLVDAPVLLRGTVAAAWEAVNHASQTCVTDTHRHTGNTTGNRLNNGTAATRVTTRITSTTVSLETLTSGVHRVLCASSALHASTHIHTHPHTSTQPCEHRQPQRQTLTLMWTYNNNNKGNRERAATAHIQQRSPATLRQLALPPTWTPESASGPSWCQ
jgi:hypothetical protein